MNKRILYHIIAETAGITVREAEAILDSILTVIEKEVLKTGSFNLHRLGTFKIVKRKQRQGRNPQTGESIIIGGKKTVTLKYSKSTFSSPIKKSTGGGDIGPGRKRGGDIGPGRKRK